MANNPTILLVYTGGTIGMVKDYKTNALRAFDFSQILEKIPELKQLNCEIDTISFEEPIDSSNMNTSYYINIAEIIAKNYNAYDGFVVLTGSDTMSYISSAVSFMFENLQKPVIFTGSQLPIGDLRTDAKENLITSIEIACASENGEPIIQEVGLYFEYKLYRANRTTKINAEQFEAFSSMNYPPLAESGVHLSFNKHLLLRNESKNSKLIFRKNLVEDIVILKLFPGITSKVVEAIVSVPNLKGLILESYGSGNAPTEAWFINLIQETINKGVRVVNVTQCAGGSVILGLYETSTDLKDMGIINGKDITTETAVAKMMYLLGEDLTEERFKYYFETPLRGEIS
ncbi:asparaginase [uncultured Tenacibaculum sp.]|uniref:asparaginase n=1 Tax=uncultured Tenacibaculum sp. TaxID=174713 RepID=UPI00261A8169|nr:asparaginase [uncultured Tenacibaculum sp.]